MVRDVVTRAVICHFRAHTSPLAAMQFTPDGTMLATASVAGHNVNIFRIVPPAPGSAGGLLDCEGGGSGIGGGGGFGGPAAAPGYAVHLFRLHRGVTPALIQSITFAPNASWAAVTSGRGTCHVFCLARPQQPGAPARAASAPLDSLPAQQLGAAARGAAAGLQRAGSGRGESGLQQQARVEDGVTGQPVKLVALGRAGGKAGLLGSGIAGAATSAALSVYGQQTGELLVCSVFAFLINRRNLLSKSRAKLQPDTLQQCSAQAAAHAAWLLCSSAVQNCPLQPAKPGQQLTPQALDCLRHCRCPPSSCSVPAGQTRQPSCSVRPSPPLPPTGL